MQPRQPDAVEAPRRFEGDRHAIRDALEEARRRTWSVASGFTDNDLGSAACDHLSPPVWDLGHIGNFEDLWLVQRIAGRGEALPGSNDTYDARRHPRRERPGLGLLDREGARTYMEAVRTASLEILAAADLDGDDALLGDGFLYWMLVLHEHQHQETLLQSAAMRGPQRYTPFCAPRPPPLNVQRGAEARRAAEGPVPTAPRDGPEWVPVPGGPFTMGREAGPGAYDNESPPTTLHVAPFRLARYPVTCGAYLEFVEADGYGDDAWWDDAGAAWRDEAALRSPLYWQRRGDAWWRRSLRDGWRPVAEVADEILCHVSWHEARAYARYRGARLPTEAEWEKACRHDPATGQEQRNPWGDGVADPSRANVDHAAWGPGPVGAYPTGASPCGAGHMVGDVWEWTETEFDAYPGFRAFPYPEYSEAFFRQGYRVLRGGSWATRGGLANGTFRNWDHPHRRQIFAGVRLARDA